MVLSALIATDSARVEYARFLDIQGDAKRIEGIEEQTQGFGAVFPFETGQRCMGDS